MSGSQFAVTPKLPATLIGVSPITVTKSGLTYTISFVTGGVGTVTRRQFFEAVAALYNMNTLFTAVSADANNAAWIEFYTSFSVAPGDPLALLTQSTFSLSSIQMNALFVYAATQPA